MYIVQVQLPKKQSVEMRKELSDYGIHAVVHRLAHYLEFVLFLCDNEEQKDRVLEKIKEYKHFTYNLNNE